MTASSSRIGFQTYVPQRMTGFAGVSKRRRGREFEEFPELVAYLMRRFPHPGEGQQSAPEAQADIKYNDIKPINDEIARLQARSPTNSARSPNSS